MEDYNEYYLGSPNESNLQVFSLKINGDILSQLSVDKKITFVSNGDQITLNVGDTTYQFKTERMDESKPSLIYQKCEDTMQQIGKIKKKYASMNFKVSNSYLEEAKQQNENFEKKNKKGTMRKTGEQFNVNKNKKELPSTIIKKTIVKIPPKIPIKSNPTPQPKPKSNNITNTIITPITTPITISNVNNNTEGNNLKDIKMNSNKITSLFNDDEEEEEEDDFLQLGEKNDSSSSTPSPPSISSISSSQTSQTNQNIKTPINQNNQINSNIVSSSIITPSIPNSTISSTKNIAKPSPPPPTTNQNNPPNSIQNNQINSNQSKKRSPKHHFTKNRFLNNLNNTSSSFPNQQNQQTTNPSNKIIPQNNSNNSNNNNSINNNLNIPPNIFGNKSKSANNSVNNSRNNSSNSSDEDSPNTKNNSLSTLPSTNNNNNNNHQNGNNNNKKHQIPNKQKITLPNKKPKIGDDNKIVNFAKSNDSKKPEILLNRKPSFNLRETSNQVSSLKPKVDEDYDTEFDREKVSERIKEFNQLYLIGRDLHKELTENSNYFKDLKSKFSSSSDDERKLEIFTRIQEEHNSRKHKIQNVLDRYNETCSKLNEIKDNLFFISQKHPIHFY